MHFSTPCRLFGRAGHNIKLPAVSRRCYAKVVNAPAAQKLKVNADRLWYVLPLSSNHGLTTPGMTSIRLLSGLNQMRRLRPEVCRGLAARLGTRWLEIGSKTRSSLSAQRSTPSTPLALNSPLSMVSTDPKGRLLISIDVAVFCIGENNDLPPVAMGSHLDSVATGGRFDGPLGVIGALEAFKSMKEQGIKTYAPIALINWTNEEGARYFPPLGSSVVYAGEKGSPVLQHLW